MSPISAVFEFTSESITKTTTVSHASRSFAGAEDAAAGFEYVFRAVAMVCATGRGCGHPIQRVNGSGHPARSSVRDKNEGLDPGSGDLLHNRRLTGRRRRRQPVTRVRLRLIRRPHSKPLPSHQIATQAAQQANDQDDAGVPAGESGGDAKRTAGSVGHAASLRRGQTQVLCGARCLFPAGNACRVRVRRTGLKRDTTIW